jgi:SAM-dependent methyltransferase
VSELSDQARRNREYWDRTSDEYHERTGRFIERGLAWGVWQVPEAELRVLGDVAGKDVLELGCGAAEWSRALARAGARPVGLDNS